MPIKSFGHEYARLAFTSGLCAACLAIAGYFPTRALAADGGLIGMGLGIGVSLLAALVGAIPICMAASQSPTKGPTAVLAGTAVRFILVLGAVVPISFSGLVHRKAFIVWVVISYLVLLMLDTLMAVSSLKAAREGPK